MTSVAWKLYEFAVVVAASSATAVVVNITWALQVCIYVWVWL